MDLNDLLQRTAPAEPWVEGDNIPWNDPAFGERMLIQHLNQDHDRASRRDEMIDAQVGWLHGTVLGSAPTRILDLACGPGLYTSRLARRGHTCHGINFAPASIAHVPNVAEEDGLACTYEQADLREARFGDGFGLAMMLFGQINVFRRVEAEDILRRTCAAGGAGPGHGLGDCGEHSSRSML